MKKPNNMLPPIIAGVVAFVFIVCLIPIILYVGSNGQIATNDHVFSTLFTALANIKSPFNIAGLFTELANNIGAYNNLIDELPALAWLIKPFGFISDFIAVVGVLFTLVFNALAIALQAIVVVLTAPFSLIVG